MEYEYYTFVFNGDPIYFEPYNEYDFIDIDAFYYERPGERRLTIIAQPISGFFKEYSWDSERESYNDSGFETDTTTPVSEYSSDYYADCEFTILADDIPLEMSRESYCAVEMTIPSENLLPLNDISIYHNNLCPMYSVLSSIVFIPLISSFP